MTVEELLDQIDDMIDKAWSFPLSGGRCVVDANHLRDIIDDIRGNIPGEVRQARAIVSDRADIIATAKREAEGIVRNAEERARGLIAHEEVVRQAQQKANELLVRPSRKPGKCAAARTNLRRTCSSARRKRWPSIWGSCGRRGRCCAIPAVRPGSRRMKTRNDG